MSGAVILTGAPGTGKSSVLDALSTLLEIDAVRFGAIETENELRGPGKAALVEHARKLAQEIHRLASIDVVVSTADRDAVEVAAEVKDVLQRRGLI